MHNALILTIPGGKAAEAFCWMLVHSLWQGLLFTIITGAVMLVTRKSSAALRYNIMCGLLFAFVAVCAGTFVWEMVHSDDIIAHVTGAPSAAIAAETVAQLWMKKVSTYFSANAPLILAGWSIIFMAKCVRMLGGLVYSHRVKHHKIYQPPVQWQHRVAALCSQLQLKKHVTLLQSGIVKIPVVIGHIKPVVFIPLGLLNSMPAGEMEAVLLHELAHIRRNDYLVNLLQVMVENVFFFNPALLWMSNIIREEREHCCDDVAVAQTKSKKQFIQALISFKEHALHVNNYATAFPAKKNQLLQRATRIINNSNKTLNTGEKAFFVVSLVLLAGLTMAVTNTGSKHIKAKLPKTTGQAVSYKQQPVQPIEAGAAPRVNVHAAARVEHIAANRIYNKQVSEKPGKPLTGNDDNAGQFAADANNVKLPIAATNDARQAEFDRQQAIRDREQAMRDAIQAELDRQQAVRDREQAERDRAQAEEDRKQALRDQVQALEARKQAEYDRAQAELDRKKAETERAEFDRQRVELDKQRVLLNKEKLNDKTLPTTILTRTVAASAPVTASGGQ